MAAYAAAALRRARTRLRQRDERGYSAIELVLYTPLIMSLTLMAVQFSMVYLGIQVASGAAREGNRVARVTGSVAQAEAKARQMTGAIGSGALESVTVSTVRVGDEMRTTVSGRATKVVPFIPPPRVSETVRGPVEQFAPDQ